MHRIFILLAAACLAVALPAQNSPRGPVTKNPNTHELTEDLVVPSARTLTVNGTFTWGTGASFSGAAAFRTAAGVQALDADLTALAAIAANGFAARTAANTWAPRTITGTAGQITVVNGDGVSGNPTLSLPATLTQATTFSAAVPSTSTTTGAVIVSNGGLGVNGAIYAQAPPASENSDRVPTTSWVNNRALAGDATRAVAPSLISDGATAARAGVATLKAATNPATRTIQIYGLVTVPTSNPSSDILLFNFAPTLYPSLTSAVSVNSLIGGIGTNGELILMQRGATTADTRRFGATTFRSTYAGRTVALSITIYGDSTTTPVIYADGVDISSSFALNTAGTTPNWLPSTLAATYYLTGYNWPAGRAPVMEYGFGAWSAAEVATWSQTGVVPSWWAAATGSAVSFVPSARSFSFGATDANTATSLTGSNVTSSVVAGARDGGAGSYLWQFTQTTTTAGRTSSLSIGPSLVGAPIGSNVVVSMWVRRLPGSIYNYLYAAGFSQQYGGGAKSTDYTFTATDTWTRHEFVLRITGNTANEFSIGFVGASGAVGDGLQIDDLEWRVLGHAARWVVQPGGPLGGVLRDIGANGLSAVYTAGMLPVTTDNRGTVRGRLTWSGSHEPKALLADQALIPPNALIDSITVLTDAATTGAGVVISDGDTVGYWSAAASHAAGTKVYRTIANRYPASSSAADLKIYVDPDSANYTGNVDVTVNYVLTY